MRYERWGPREVTRTLEPLGLVLNAGSWYLIASADGREIRSYRVARIRALEMLADTFARPGDFDLASSWEAHSREPPGRLYWPVPPCPRRNVSATVNENQRAPAM